MLKLHLLEWHQLIKSQIIQWIMMDSLLLFSVFGNIDFKSEEI